MIASFRLSLRQRLLVGLLIVSIGCLSVIAGITIRDAIDETYELFDVHLAQTALALLRVTDPDDDDPYPVPKSGETPSLREIFPRLPHLPERLAGARSAPGSADGHAFSAAPAPGGPAKLESMDSLQQEYEQQLRYQIWNAEGQLLLRSANAPKEVMTQQDGFSETADNEGRLWRYFGVWDRHFHFRILVAEDHDVRHRLVRVLALKLASPLAFGLPVLIFLLWFSISRGLDPLGTLTREIEKRRPENLAPLDAGNAPREVRPMVLALNELLLRVADTLESERRFTANAAHELRTPLAAIQAQLHAARASEGQAERQHSMDQLQRGVERGIRLVGQLLTLARLDPEQSLQDILPVNLGEVAEDVCAELAPLALQREQIMELKVAPDLPLLQGNADMLSMLLSNLVDNAIRYTQRNGHITVAVRPLATGLLMEVSDNGPGIPLAQRGQVFDRFYRIAGQDQPGTGLGLSICWRIAELHNAQIHLADGLDGTGLTVSVLIQG